jgi:twinkle protein
MNLGDALDKLTVSQSTVDAYYQQEEYSHAEFKIKSADSFTDLVLHYYNHEINSGKSLGFSKTEDKFRIRPAELTVLTGISGHGKSMWLSQVILNILKDTKVLLASLEMRPVLSISRMIQQTLGSPEPTDDYVRKFCSRAADKLYIYDQTGVTTSDDMIATLYYSKYVLGINVAIIDSLMKMSDISEESMEKQKLFVDRLAVTCRDLEIHVFLVAHSKKPSTTEEDVPDATQILGSSHIRNLCDNIICVHRSKRKERLIDEGKTLEEDLRKIPDAVVTVQKQRNFTFEGSFAFWFDPKGLRYRESPSEVRNYRMV